MLSCEFYEISKNTFFTAHVWTTASIDPFETQNEWTNLFTQSFFMLTKTFYNIYTSCNLYTPVI